jgi:23S rRNA G2445 N2-methylase RlmL
MKNKQQGSDKALERRIKKHIHAQLHTVECSVPPGFIELGKRRAAEILKEHSSSDPQAQTKIEIHGNSVRIENLPFEAVHELLYEGLVFTEVKIRVVRSRCSTEDKLEKIVSEVDWRLWLPAIASDSWDVRVDSLNSQLYHEGRIKRLFLDAIGKLKLPKGMKLPDNSCPTLVALDITLQREVLEIFLSLGGRSFWKRGHKQSMQHAAPLREDIAACLVQRLAEISHEQLNVATPTHVLNPFCGTGTLLHEAALMISRTAHLLSENHRLSYIFLPFFKENAFAHVRKRKLAKLEPKGKNVANPVLYVGEDLDQGLCMASEKWFDEAKLKIEIPASVNCFQVDSCKRNEHISKLSVDHSLWILANPPFGLRLSNDSRGGSEKVYQLFGSRLSELMSSLAKKNVNACGVVLCPDEDTWRNVQRELRQYQQFCEHLTLGGLDIRALYFTSRPRS